MDYTHLNRAYLANRPLPSPDKLVDETVKCQLFSFMDSFRGYYQIFLVEKKKDQKIAL